MLNYFLLFCEHVFRCLYAGYCWLTVCSTEEVLISYLISLYPNDKEGLQQALHVIIFSPGGLIVEAGFGEMNKTESRANAQCDLHLLMRLLCLGLLKL